MRQTLYNHSLVRLALTSAARTNGTVVGPAIDTAVFGNVFRTVLFAVLTATLTDGSHAFTVEESDNGSTGWAAVDSLVMQGTASTLVATADDTIFEFGVITTAKRYLRLSVVTSGATTGGVFGAVAILSGPKSPVARS